MFASAKGKQQKQVRQLKCQEQCIDHIPYYLSRFSRHIFSQNLSRNSCIRPWRWRAARSKKQTVARSGFSPALHRGVVVSQPRLHIFVLNINSNRAFSRHVKFRFPFVTCIFQWIICVHSGQFSLLSQNSIMHQAVKTNRSYIILTIPSSDAISDPVRQLSFVALFMLCCNFSKQCSVEECSGRCCVNNLRF